MGGHSKEPWTACDDGKCSCKVISDAEAPIAKVYAGEWGDEFADIRLVEEAGYTGNRAEPFVNKIVYGSISEEEARANARRICLAVNATAGLSDAALSQDVIAVVREALEETIAALDSPGMLKLWGNAIGMLGGYSGPRVDMERLRAALALLATDKRE